MKKRAGIFIVLAIVLLGVIASVIYNNQAHVIISKNFGFVLEKDAEILYKKREFNIDALDFSCEIAVRIKESEYQDVLNNIKNAGYESYDDEEWRKETYGWEAKNWMSLDDVKPQIERYERQWVNKIFFISNVRHHSTIHITDSIDGYRELYMSDG